MLIFGGELTSTLTKGNMCGSPGDVSEATEGLEKELWRRWIDERVGEWAVTKGLENEQRVILQPLPLLHVRRSSFYNPSVASPTSQAHSLTLPSLHLRHSLFSIASPTSQLILQPFRHFTYTTAHSLILPSLHLRHISFYTITSIHLHHRLIL